MVQELTKEILKVLGNNHTTIKELPDIRCNYYNYITDTIYLVTNIDNNNKKRLDKTNLFCAKLVTICHECIHSIQNKLLHILNFVLSNLSFVITLIAIILMITASKPIWYIICGSIVVILAMLIRIVLEIDAIYGSLKLAELMVINLKIDNVNISDIGEARKIVNSLLPVQILKMVLDKIIMLIIIFV